MATKSRSYKKVSCHKTAGAAKSAQKTMHNAGKTARVVKTGEGYCVTSAGERKAVRLRTGQVLAVVKRVKKASKK